MRYLTSFLIVGVVLEMCEAGVLGIREAATQPCSPVTIWNFATVYATVTIAPPTVTIIQQDPNAVASSMAFQNTIYYSNLVVEAPVSGMPLPPYTFTDTVRVSGYEATELSNIPVGTVFYESKSASGTASPVASIAAAVTTVTVSPVPVTSTQKQKEQVNGTTIAATDGSVHSAFTSPYGGWNVSTANSSLVGPGTTGSGTFPGASGLSASSTGVQPASTSLLRTSTVTQIATVFVTVPPESTYGYAPPPAYGTEAPISDGIEKRQTCVWISATIGGQEVGWCNNWAGGSTYTFTSWETTITPDYIPGIGTITHHSSRPASSVTRSVTIQTSTPSPTIATPSPTATVCGESGPFQITFDDLIPNGSDADHPEAPMIQNPYSYLNWGDGWTYVPPPNDPFPSQSGDRLAEWDPSVNNTILGSPNAGSIPPGSIGAWDRNSSFYWFNATSAYVGCDNSATNLSQFCDFVATAYQWNEATQSEVVAATEHFHIAPCPDFVDCQLTKINFNKLFHRMSTLQFYANVQGNISKFWMDTIDMDWYDNSCAAGLARISGQD
ncbi:hypothetical protein H2200_011604 [Cladophialophora chaetospira]|uniref:DUF7371 domain-containing protein n=1 Tax=Cladophialophora chaetospira TaxID=386627 RepID=A0AA38WZM3_9EURO|nr:hypothetical protein H2200_011604 [Cladophialophora chaetospira]